MKKYVCGVCGYIYNEAAGIPDSGISPGTKWEDLPESWVCPWCGAAKSAFAEQVPAGGEPSSGQKKTAVESVIADSDEEDLREMTAGEMSVLCSNLAKGCEKQYLKEEQALYTRLAEYFKERTPEAETADWQSMKELAARDLDRLFPEADQAAGAEQDRGALRALVWSKKVSNMLNSLLDRYEKEGDSFLEHTNVYVCDICGFIYIGDTPPDLCPVCKVPNWKMSKVERR